MFKSVGLVGRWDRKETTQLTRKLAEYLSAKGLKIYVESSLARKIGSKEDEVPLEQMRTDFIITIGGDGTILRASLLIPIPETPLLAINMGVRGFLTEVEPKQAFTAVDKMIDGEFFLEKHIKLSVIANDIVFPDALNEVLITADEPVNYSMHKS